MAEHSRRTNKLNRQYRKAQMIKKIIATAVITTALLFGASNMANAVSDTNKIKVKMVLEEAGLESMWSTDISLWVKNPGFDKYTLESFGHQICAGTKHQTGFYVITFWHQFGQGQITKVKCS